ncbi:MAG: hypothetical protein ACRDRL_27830 [Sciscionella sp.]
MSARITVTGRHSSRNADQGAVSIRRWRRDAVVAFAVCVAVGILAAIPLATNRDFYFWNDSAARFLPVWHHLGKVIAGGGWPPLLDVNMWMGGNIAAEAVYGIYNPINLLNYLMVSALPDLAVAAALVVAEFMALLALGVYILSREYGAARWASAAVAVAIPFAGFTLYFDAAAWPSGLMAFAYIPHVWWSLRRVARGKLNPFWAFLIGALAVTSGYPYAVIAVGIIALALIVEFAVRHHRRAAIHILLVGLCIGAIAPLVYLPLAGTAPVTGRAGQAITNNGFLVPGIGDPLTMSVPLYRPRIDTFAGPLMTTPIMYLAWFVLPLLPWLHWRELRARWRSLLSVFIAVAAFMLLMLGPSQLWLFRTLLRVIDYVYLGVGVLFAVLLSHGLRRDHWRARTAVTSGILLIGAYLSWATHPHTKKLIVLSLVILAVLCAAALTLSMRRNGNRWLAGVLCVGTAGVLGFQTWAIPGNLDLWAGHFPHSVQRLRSTFADRYLGTTMQFAAAPPAADQRPDRAWRDILFGSLYLPAGVDAVDQYTDLGISKFADTLCINNYYSTACAKGYQALWKPTPDGGRSLADLMKLDTVVVQNTLVAQISPPPGWQVIQHDNTVTVLRRNERPPWQEGHLSWASAGVHVLRDNSPTDTGENVRFRRSGEAEGTGHLTFARLNWPGYQAAVNGRSVPVVDGPAGLVTVDLPRGVSAGEVTLTWTPPGFWVGVAACFVGLLGALLLAGSYLWRRRGAARKPTGSTAQEGPPMVEDRA